MKLNFKVLALDAADIKALATFYTTILGWTILDEDDDWITIHDPSNPSTTALAFQRAPDHVAPTWPDNTIPQQAHPDFYVDDLDEAEAHVLAAGARATGMPLESRDFRVYLDPAGHPFCLCQQ
jgi:predicted enzyme related to lactoylglutathione lyase